MAAFILESLVLRGVLVVGDESTGLKRYGSVQANRQTPADHLERPCLSSDDPQPDAIGSACDHPPALMCGRMVRGPIANGLAGSELGDSACRSNARWACGSIRFPMPLAASNPGNSLAVRLANDAKMTAGSYARFTRGHHPLFAGLALGKRRTVGIPETTLAANGSAGCWLPSSAV